MANGNVTSRTAAVLLMKDGADGVADTGAVTSGVFNGQNLQPCYIPSASQILPAGSVPLTALAQGGAVSTNVLVWNGTAWAPSAAAAGTVTSVGLTVPSILSVAGSPVTTAGTLAVTLATQTANTVWAGPTTGGAAAPTFRALVAADIPGILSTTVFSGDVTSTDFIVSPNTGFVQWTSATKLLSQADGVLQITTAAGTFGSILLGATAVATGVKLVATNSTLTLFKGDGSTGGVALAVGSGTATGNFSFNQNNGANSGAYMGASGLGIALVYTGTSNVYQLVTSGGVLGSGGYLIQGTYTVSQISSPKTLVAADNGTHYTNAGALGTVQFNLPTAARGLTFKFTCTDAQTVIVNAGSTILNGSGATNTAKTTVTAAGASTGRFTNFSVVCYDGTNWAVQSLDGVVAYA